MCSRFCAIFRGINDEARSIGMKKQLVVGFIIALSLALGWHLAQSDDDEEGKISGLWKRTPDVLPVDNALYAEECGSCHMAYPAGLLPARSWEKLMQGLDNHFGDIAELDSNTLAALTRYLVDNSADGSPYRRSRKIVRSIGAGDAPLRITEVPYIQYEHREIPKRLVSDNAEVGTLGNCVACHRRIAQGSFSEREIRIPGYGRWDD